MKRPVAPCQDCKHRTSWCHKKCKKYLKFEKENAVFRENFYKERIPDTYKCESSYRFSLYRRK